MALDHRIAIVGGGLSGLYAALLLEQHGISDYVVVEARSRLGGRIDSLSIGNQVAVDRFDLGATWFWPEMQPQFSRLVEELGLQRFLQNEEGDILLERSLSSKPVRTPNYLVSPSSMRLVGGMTSLVDALRTRVPATRIICGLRIRRMKMTDDGIQLEAIDAAQNPQYFQAQCVLVAIPPRLAANIEYSPALPEPLLNSWKATATWMAPHAKYLAVFEKPFWRANGLSGGARSSVGPLVEIHDAATPDGHAALFGFIGVPAHVRRQHPDSTLLTHCRAQLVRLFGEQARTPQEDFMKDWADDPFTATVHDCVADGSHGYAPPASTGTGRWDGRLFGIASEWSSSFPGYLAGAIDAASWGVSKLLTVPLR